jgi:hypothetical protein
MMLAEH